eukprot:801262-Pleurochrysis_carterae.AAC.1
MPKTSRRPQADLLLVARVFCVNMSIPRDRRVKACAEGAHWKGDNGARVAFMKIHNRMHQPEWSMRGVQINRGGEMSAVSRILDDEFAASVARSTQKVRGSSHQFVRLV